ncbi:MAG TPA: McrC family protein [Spirochaetota bacterium]|nr:McrC family protein [Spirochaetota bacterium]
MHHKIRHYTIREYGHIAPGDFEREEDGILRIKEQDYNNLEDFVLRNSGDAVSEGSEFFSLTHKKGVGRCLQAKNYVGVIQTDSGLVIEILPKIHREERGEEGNVPDTRRLFLRMLRTVRDSPFKQFNESDIATYRMHIMEIFIRLFIKEMNELVRQGIRSGYVTMEENSKFLKGKLRINDHIKKNMVHKERFFIEYDDFIRDRPENRLIKSTLSLLLKSSGSNDNLKRLRELVFIFDDVCESSDIKGDFTRCVNNRLMKHYDTVLKWCRVFLQGESFTNWKGNGRVNAILFPMNEVFESYVTSVLRQSGIFDEFKAQSRDKYLAEENGKGIFQLIPDITASAGDTFYIMDAKWKLINGSDRVNKYGVSQSDMYQLLSYAKIYGKDHPDIKMALIYPANENFNEPISFKYNDAAGILLTLWPFDIDRSVKESGYCRDWTVNSMRIQGSP